MDLLTAVSRLRSPFQRTRIARSPFQGLCGMAQPLVETPGIVSLTLALGLIALPEAVQAQQGTSGVYWQCVPPSSDVSQGAYCPVSNVYPLPNGPAINALVPVAPSQTGLAISSATGMTIPTGATVALVQAQGTNGATGVCLLWRDDGSNPTAGSGQGLAANSSIWIKTSSAFKMIAATGATCAAVISYYK